MSLTIKGVVKYVTSGDTLVVKHPKKQLEKYINLAGVDAPRFNKKDEKDEVCLVFHFLINFKSKVIWFCCKRIC